MLHAEQAVLTEALSGANSRQEGLEASLRAFLDGAAERLESTRNSVADTADISVRRPRVTTRQVAALSHAILEADTRMAKLGGLGIDIGELWSEIIRERETARATDVAVQIKHFEWALRDTLEDARADHGRLRADLTEQFAAIGRMKLREEEFARWATTPRALFGLLWLRLVGRPSAAIDRITDQARNAGLSVEAVQKITHWLPRRRVILGLLRRSALGQDTGARDSIRHLIETANFDRDFGNILDNARAEIQTLTAENAALRAEIGAALSNLQDLELAHHSTNAIAQKLAAELELLRAIEEAKIADEKTIADLRVEVASLMHALSRAGR